MRDTLIIGGTGTLGRALLERIDPARTIVLSRDELKQQQLRKDFPELKTVLGDIRDPQAFSCMKDMKTVYHVAALKHVDILEAHPAEAYATNTVGTMNAARAAQKFDVREFKFTSTDKACLPINAYGYSKAMAERFLINENEQKPFATKFKVFRWGNILGSRGSAIPYFAKTLKEKGKVYLTDEKMTRFWMLIEDAVDFMIDPLGWHHLNEVNYPSMKSATVVAVIRAVAEVIGVSKWDTEIIGLRPGEKIHESLFFSPKLHINSETAERYSHQELVKLVKAIL